MHPNGKKEQESTSQEAGCAGPELPQNWGRSPEQEVTRAARLLQLLKSTWRALSLCHANDFQRSWRDTKSLHL